MCINDISFVIHASMTVGSLFKAYLKIIVQPMTNKNSAIGDSVAKIYYNIITANFYSLMFKYAM